MHDISIEEYIRVEDTICYVVDAARLPFFDLVLIIMVVVPEIDTGHTSGVVFGTLFSIDYSVAEAENRAFEQALIDAQLHSCLPLFGSPTIVGLSGRVVTNNIRVKEAVINIGGRGIAMKHQP